VQVALQDFLDGVQREAVVNAPNLTIPRSDKIESVEDGLGSDSLIAKVLLVPGLRSRVRAPRDHLPEPGIEGFAHACFLKRTAKTMLTELRGYA
jgi:hypothetical protein